MRARRLPSLSLAASCCALTIVFSVGVPAVNAQQASVSIQPLDKVDTNAYRIFFRRAVLYKKLADQADASHTPKPQLRHILASRFELSGFDSANLDKLALAYKSEIDPLHQQTLTVIRQFHARFPSGIIPKGADASPPP